MEFSVCDVITTQYETTYKMDMHIPNIFIFRMIQDLQLSKEMDTQINLTTIAKMQRKIPSDYRNVLAIIENRSFFVNPAAAAAAAATMINTNNLKKAGSLADNHISYQFPPLLFKMNCNAILPGLHAGDIEKVTSLVQDLIMNFEIFRKEEGAGEGGGTVGNFKEYIETTDIDTLFDELAGIEEEDVINELIISLTNSIDNTLLNQSYKELLSLLFVSDTVVLKDRGGILLSKYLVQEHQHKRQQQQNKISDSAFVAFMYGQIALFYVHQLRLLKANEHSFILEHKKPIVYAFSKNQVLRFPKHSHDITFLALHTEPVFSVNVQDIGISRSEVSAWSKEEGYRNVQFPPLEAFESGGVAHDCVLELLSEPEMSYAQLISLIMKHMKKYQIHSIDDFDDGSVGDKGLNYYYQSIDGYGEQPVTQIIGETLSRKAKTLFRASKKTVGEVRAGRKEKGKTGLFKTFKKAKSEIEKGRQAKIEDYETRSSSMTKMQRSKVFIEYFSTVESVNFDWNSHFLVDDDKDIIRRAKMIGSVNEAISIYLEKICKLEKDCTSRIRNCRRVNDCFLSTRQEERLTNVNTIIEVTERKGLDLKQFDSNIKDIKAKSAAPNDLLCFDQPIQKYKLMYYLELSEKELTTEKKTVSINMKIYFNNPANSAVYRNAMDKLKI